MKTPVFEVYKAKDGWRWRLWSKNNRIIATGEAHTRKADAERALRTLVETAKQFFDEDGDHMRHNFKTAKRGAVINTFCVKGLGKPMLAQHQIAKALGAHTTAASRRNA